MGLMDIISKTGDAKFAEVYVAQVRGDEKALIEFVDARDPRFPKSEKWVIIVSTQIGCPVGCLMCDSGTYFYGNLTKEEIFAQIDHVIENPPNPPLGKGGLSSHPKLKIQFARMGEPSLNPAVLDVLRELSARYKINGLMPCIASTAPKGNEAWFEELAVIKDKYFSNGRFQLQFSLNSTDEAERDKFMPVEKWRLGEIADYGERFYKKGDRKVTLNFALAKDATFETKAVKDIFNPKKFLIKITPVNPTGLAVENNIKTVLSPDFPCAADDLASELDNLGFETIISIGAPEEIAIGSNCGQSARKQLRSSIL